MNAGVVIVGAGPVGCTAALLIADRGVPVQIVERHLSPHPLPRAVHLDDEVARILAAAGIGAEFLAASRPLTGLRLLDAKHRVLAHFERSTALSDNGFPYANMFDQPQLEALLLERVARHPLITVHRGVEVQSIEGLSAGTPESGVRVHGERTCDGSPVLLTGHYVLGCDGANSTVRDLLDIEMDDLNFTERWLVVDVRSARALDTVGSADQICDPDRAATFMRVVGDRYRWEFQIRDDEADEELTSPQRLAQLLRPWTGRGDLSDVEVVRSASYVFRARLARRFQHGRAFLLGDAAHLTPPFVGQGLGMGLRDAHNLSWKLADVLTGRACAELLATYEAERRRHARSLIRRAVAIGWAMTGGQDRAAAVRRVALAVAVRVPWLRSTIANPATPPLRRGALDRRSRWRAGRTLAVGSQCPNPLLTLRTGERMRLDDVRAGRAAVLVARPPDEALARSSRDGVVVIGLADRWTAAERARAADGAIAAVLGDADNRLARLLDDPDLTVLVRPDGVVAAARRKAPAVFPWAQPAEPPRPAPAANLAAPAAPAATVGTPRRLSSTRASTSGRP